MTLIENAIPQVSVSVREEERFFAPERADRFWSRSRFIGLLALVLVLHASVIGYFLYRDATTPDQMAQAEETPVDVVMEPPPPPPPPPPPKEPAPAPKQQQDMSEKPASSAPRAPSETPVDTKMTDAKTEAPKAAPPPRDGQPEPAREDASAAEAPAAPEVKETAASKLEDDKREAEALDKAKPEPEKKPETREAKVKPKSNDATEAARQLSGLSDLPSYRFAAATKMSDLPAGTEDNRYLAVVYGKIMSKNHYASSAAARRGMHGIVSVTFVVDFMGRIARQVVTESSGHPDLDAIAMASVRAAAPFPFPPGSGPQELIWRADFKP